MKPEGPEDYLRDVEALRALALELTAAERPSDVAEAVSRSADELLRRIWVNLALADADRRELRFLGVEHLRGEARPVPLEEGHPASDAALSGEMIVIAGHDEMRTRYPGPAARGERGPIAALPLVSGGDAVGVLVARAADGTFDARERGLLGAMAASVGQALARTRADEATRTIARVLQQSLAPPRLTPPEWCDVGLRFEAMGTGVAVGGDFYDLFAEGDTWYLVVGDACGKGPRAAVLATTARQQARSLARRHLSPSDLLGALNDEILLHAEEGHLFVTAALASLAPEGAGVRAVVARAGHPAPVVRRSSGEVERVGVDGTLLGIERDIRAGDAVLHLAAGDVLLLYTDGLTEARDRSGDALGEERLLEAVVSAPAGGANVLVDAVVESALAFADGPLSDDLAVVAVAVPR